MKCHNTTKPLLCELFDSYHLASGQLCLGSSIGLLDQILSKKERIQVPKAICLSWNKDSDKNRQNRRDIAIPARAQQRDELGTAIQTALNS